MTREEAIKILKSKLDGSVDTSWEWTETVRMAIEALADRPTGEWIEVDSFESEKHSVTDMRCNLCGKYASMVLPHRTRCVYDYCPNCGAKMRGEEE